MKKYLAGLAVIAGLSVTPVGSPVEAKVTGCYGIQDRRVIPNYGRLSCPAGNGSGYVEEVIYCKNSSTGTTRSATGYKPSGVPLILSIRCPSTHPYIFKVTWSSWG